MTFLGKNLRAELLGHQVGVFLTTQGTVNFFLKIAPLFYSPKGNIHEFHILTSILKILAIPVGIGKYFIMAFICVSMLTNGVKNFLKCLLVIYIFSFVKCLHIFCLFKTFGCLSFYY